MNKIGIVVAMDVEFRLINMLLEDRVERVVNGNPFVEGKIGNRTVVLARSGIGKVCSAVGIVEMIHRFRPDCIINSGVAGGIDEAVRVMDVVVGKTVVYHDVWCGKGNKYGQIQGMPAKFCADKRLYRAALSVKSDVKIYGGLICSGDMFVSDRKELSRIKGKFPGGLAVDMESCSAAQVCYVYGVPFLSFRIISDTPGVKEHYTQYRDFWTIAPEKSFGILKQLLSII